MTSTFLPSGYPATTGDNYINFMAWQVRVHVCVCACVCTVCVLEKHKRKESVCVDCIHRCFHGEGMVHGNCGAGRSLQGPPTHHSAHLPPHHVLHCALRRLPPTLQGLNNIAVTANSGERRAARGPPPTAAAPH